MARCQPVGYLLAAGDSALASGLLGRTGLERVADELPLAPAAILRQADRRSGSFAESVFRAGLLQAGIPFQMQVTIGPMRVDFLLGTRLVIEVDGRAFHADDTSFERDRARDAALSVLGYRVLRFSYAQVVHRWSDVEAAIRAALRRGDHH
jgi:very-short-patch-repair endonuclease